MTIYDKITCDRTKLYNILSIDANDVIDKKCDNKLDKLDKSNKSNKSNNSINSIGLTMESIKRIRIYFYEKTIFGYEEMMASNTNFDYMMKQLNCDTPNISPDSTVELWLYDDIILSLKREIDILYFIKVSEYDNPTNIEIIKKVSNEISLILMDKKDRKNIKKQISQSIETHSNNKSVYDKNIVLEFLQIDCDILNMFYNIVEYDNLIRDIWLNIIVPFIK